MRLIPGGRSSALLIGHGAGPRPALRMPAAIQSCGNVPFRLPLIAEIAGVDFDAAAALLDELVADGGAIQLDTRYPRYITQTADGDVALARAHAQAVCRLFAHWANEDRE